VVRLQLLDFQQIAEGQLLENTVNYFSVGQDKIGGRPVPYVGQLKAVTGAGKTPILTSVIGKLSPSIVLWTTKFGSVVDQTVANLRPGGKYHHLLGNGPVEVLKFSDIPSFASWQRILEATEGTTIIISTVATWNAPDKKSAEKDERLNVHRIHPDWGGHLSRWDQLKFDRKRKLWIVYDEAHNTTSEQIDQLDELEPAGFFVASASSLKGKLLLYLTNLPEEIRKQRIVPVRTFDVVEAQLLKSTISFADYNSPTEAIIIDAAKRRQELERKFGVLGESTIPKAIYVVETSNVAAKGVETRPVAIWRLLTGKCGIAPDSIAVCTNTKDLPQGAIRVETIDQLSDNFTHIIFNKKLQEGWDDPSVYVCYFDGKTDSATRIQQVIGRALRQPNAKHLSDEDLNTGFFSLTAQTKL
jgi:type III restriction enzyme